MQINGGYTDNYYYGIRRFPYARAVGHGWPAQRPAAQPADVRRHRLRRRSTSPTAPTHVARRRRPRRIQVHNIGEVWASTLYEVRARFVTRLGFATGNQRFLQFVTDGMKLDPAANPTLLQAATRLSPPPMPAAARAADIADIWAGFASPRTGRQRVSDQRRNGRKQHSGGRGVRDTRHQSGPGDAGVRGHSERRDRATEGRWAQVFCVINGGRPVARSGHAAVESGGVVSSSAPQSLRHESREPCTACRHSRSRRARLVAVPSRQPCKPRRRGAADQELHPTTLVVGWRRRAVPDPELRRRGRAGAPGGKWTTSTWMPGPPTSGPPTPRRRTPRPTGRSWPTLPPSAITSS